ncbi:histidine kinase dimerization/phospho-acceptor domain-containing protein [Myxococcus sp. NMCA1]|uniref:histidine kinase dimerization/phospho-acceptor domain-containing protein n=1 Tax=Myxococcus sp. NMCA1 TaxID=2996785 RepID=UPI0022862279|nr:histidine kinase dimerization/phospho-acceptor domain-containing protein [Myxococcus sp. NMCA1]WAM26764.1 hypothetical protein OZ403_01195 [Myxococcus sp. NMCA1]
MLGAVLAWLGRRQVVTLAGESEALLERARAQADAPRASEARLEARVVQRTQELTLANQELESFSDSVSHDLRAPLRAVDGFSLALQEEDGARLSEEGHEHLRRLRAAVVRMGQFIDDLLRLSRISRIEPRHAPVDLSALASVVAGR